MKRQQNLVRPVYLTCFGLFASAAHGQKLESVTVNALPLGDTSLESSQPVSVMRGAELDQQRAGSLGDTIGRLPGVHSSGFGTAAGRPIIRGQNGPRVSVLENGLETLDASSLSPDHAVTVDPLGQRQVEVLRGPATLLYGSGAIGGVVNAVSEWIPSSAIRGFGAEALLGHDSAARETLGSFRLRGGTAAGAATGATQASPAGGSFNWTLGGFARDAGDYAVPVGGINGRLPNSFSKGQGFSGGASWIGSWGTVGVSHSVLDSRYGIPAEPGVVIDQGNHRTEGVVELFEPLPMLESLRLRATEVRYRHEEIETDSGEIGTAFTSKGRDLRLEAIHRPIGGMRGAFGVHSRDRTLSASGEEAYIPSTRERENALFWVGERPIGSAKLNAGFRFGRAQRDPALDAGLPARSFDLSSWSIGTLLPISGPLAVSASFSSAQRAPAIEELYARGPHAATATYEIGNPLLNKESSRNLELAIQNTSGALRWKLGVFEQRFSNYIAGFYNDDNGDGVPDRVNDVNETVNSPGNPGDGELARLTYRQAPARFRGLEAEMAWRSTTSPWGFRAFGDAVRGTVDGLGAAPRMPPLRVGASADYRAGPWSGFVSVLTAAKQDRVSVFETETPGYTRIDAEVAYQLKLGSGTAATLFIQGRNLLNEDIRLSTSFVKDAVPMPGRSVYAGIRLRL